MNKIMDKIKQTELKLKKAYPEHVLDMAMKIAEQVVDDEMKLGLTNLADAYFIRIGAMAGVLKKWEMEQQGG